MKTWVLRIRKSDNKIFEMIKSGQKTVETRAATKDFQKGDRIIFDCDNKKIEKTVSAIRKYADFEEYLAKEDLAKIFGPGITKEKAREIHFSFPGYQEKLKQYGIIAIELTE